ncbi:MAG: hypothetical protein ABIK73_07830 [candidate division WOR-3 bacterium]
MQPKPSVFKSKDGSQFYGFMFGGSQGWFYRLPLSTSDYPAEEEFDWEKEQFKLVPTGEIGWHRNENFVLERQNVADGKILILVDKAPVKGGTVDFAVSGDCKTIIKAPTVFAPNLQFGYARSGAVLVHGPCKIEINSIVKNQCNRLIAIYDGQDWHIGTKQELLLEEAIFGEKFLDKWV